MTAARRWWAGPPGPLFHALLAVPLGVLLVAASEPVLDPLLALAAVGALLGLAVVWAVRLVVVLVGGSPARWFAPAPAAVVVVAGLLLLGVPLDVRWSLDRPAFTTASQRADVAARDYLGTHDVTRVRDLPGAAVAYDLAGTGFLDDTGYAYLPDGPTGEVAAAFESVRFTRLDGDWWIFAAGW